MKTENGSTPQWYESMTFKMALLGVMAIMFIIPLELIREVIRERESNSATVQSEIASQWGNIQTVSGPVLNVPVYRNPDGSEKNYRQEIKIWHLLPDALAVRGTLEPEIRYKGIYETVIYTADLSISGNFLIEALPDREKFTLLWDEAYITLGVSDNRGLKDRVTILVNEKEVVATPGVSDQDLYNSGITFPVGLEAEDRSISFSASLALRGSSGLYFTPVGKKSEVSLSSGWQSPSFSGSFLPEERSVGKEGFTASWLVTDLNRNFPQEWTGSGYLPSDESFGVDLILEADHYQKSERSAKYGMLFIAFTFLVLIYIELSSNKSIHLFNYFLVSLALVLFFSLLNSLSEHLGFNIAYVISSLSTISLITYFTRSLLGERTPVLIVAMMLTVLYVFIFILLALKEFSYLAGNIGLFIALAFIMRLTSRTDLFRKGGL